MSEPIDATRMIVDGYYGLPIEIQPDHGPRAGTIEWLLETVQRHAAAETESLAQYAAVGEASGDPVIALVMQLILEDEERHHGLLRRIEDTLRDTINWTHSPASLPEAVPVRQPAPGDLVAIVQELIAEEHTGAKKLHDIAHREKDLDGGLPAILLEMMAIDSGKHARLLQYVHDRLAARHG